MSVTWWPRSLLVGKLQIAMNLPPSVSGLNLPLSNPVRSWRIKAQRDQLDGASQGVRDIGLLYQSTDSLTDDDKFELLTCHWKPPHGYRFPSEKMYGKNRSFSRDCLKLYSWLVYSPSLDGAFCLPCVLFGMKSGHNTGKLDKLYRSPLRNWVSAAQKLAEHNSKSQFHKQAIEFAEGFKAVQTKKLIPVKQQINSALPKRVAENKRKIESIIKTIILCGRQNIASRGDRDDSTADPTSNRGNFHALLEFRVESGDTVLEEHIRSVRKNATYTSKTIQNEIIDLIGKHMQSEIVKMIWKNQPFSILADEACDVSNKEQLPLVLRFVDTESTIREMFVGFFECKEGTTGRVIADLILEAVTNLGLDMEQCRGQCYDGAGNMAGKCKGAAALIRDQFQRAEYVHCNSHKLNLCVVKACSVQDVRNMMGTLEELCRFFGFSPKRQQLLEHKIQDKKPQSTHRKLKDLCKTRWVQRLDALEVFEELLLPVVYTLEDIKANAGGSWNKRIHLQSQRTVTPDHRFWLHHDLHGDKGMSDVHQRGDCATAKSKNGCETSIGQHQQHH